MIFVAVILIVVSFLVLTNRNGVVKAIYEDAANEFKAKYEQDDYDEAVLEQEARAIEAHVVRTDESLLYGGIFLGLLGLVFLHAGLVSGVNRVEAVVSEPRLLTPAEVKDLIGDTETDDDEIPTEEEPSENA